MWGRVSAGIEQQKLPAQALALRFPAPLHPPHPPTRYHLPLAELGGDFYDELKSLSSGYASFDYEEAEYR